MHRKFYTLIITCLLFSTLSFSQTTINATLNFDGEERNYEVFLPTGYQDGMELPMVFNLHGFGSNAFQQTFYTALNLVADTANFIVVTPEGLVRTTIFGQTNTHWNAYFGSDVDDLGFLNLLIDQLYTDYTIDLSRVYATGMSNGGFMSYMLACELSGRIAAIASVTGITLNEQLDNCSPSRAVPVMQIHGTADDVVPFGGIGIFTPSVNELVDHWVTHNNCDTPADTLLIPDIDTNDDSTAEMLKYTNGNEGSEVWYYIIDGGGHTWPDASIDLPGVVTNRDFNASEHIWDFFNQFVHPNPDAGTLVSNENILAQAIESIEILALPTSRELVITAENDEIEQVQLWDMLGRQVMEANQLSALENVRLDVPNVTTGIYVATVKTKKGILSKKVFF